MGTPGTTHKISPTLAQIYTTKHRAFFQRNSQRVRRVNMHTLYNPAHLHDILGEVGVLPLHHTLEIDLSLDDAREEGDEEENPLGFEAYVFPSFLLEGGVPALRHLKLASAVLANPNSIGSLTGLTYLELDTGEQRFDGRRGGHLLSVEALLELLSHSPQLTVLILWQYLADPDEAMAMPRPPASIPLLSMQGLRVNESVTSITTLYRTSRFLPLCPPSSYPIAYPPAIPLMTSTR